MGEWLKVVTHPLGLAGFALFAAFIFLTRPKTLTLPVWMRTSFIVMAFIALLGGLWLARNDTTLPVERKTSAQQETIPEPNHQAEASKQKAAGENKVNQKTTGAGSPAVANTGGDVTITVTKP